MLCAPEPVIIKLVEDIKLLLYGFISNDKIIVNILNIDYKEQFNTIRVNQGS